MNLLLISEYIAPVQAVASIRWTKIAKYLKRGHDVTITVLTDQKNWEHKKGSVLHNSPEVDETLLADMENFSQYCEVPCGRLTIVYLTLRRWVRGSAESNIGMTVSQAKAPTGLFQSAKSAAKWLAYDARTYLHARDIWKFYEISVRQKPDVVISSHGPAWTHLVGEKIKRADPDIVWFADFRDPYVSEMTDPFTKWRHKRFTMRHCAAANKVLRAADTIPTYTPPDVAVRLVSNGFDPEEVLPPLRPRYFDLVFTGTLYGKRTDIGVFCEALKQLCAEGKIQREDVSVLYVGKEETVAKDLAKRYHAGEFLKTIGLLPRSEARKLQQTAAILLQVGWNTKTEKCLWTGKTYEYMAAQKPILYLVSGDVPYSEPSKYIGRLGGCCYEQCRHEETWQGMKDYILEKYLEWKTTGNVTVHQDREYIERYSYANIAEQLWWLIWEETRN